MSRFARRSRTSALLLLPLLAWGCAAPPQPTGPTALVVHLSDRDAFLDETLSALRLHRFEPEWVDRTHGTIITAPATTAQWFEIWRSDARGAYQSFEASIHTVRRRVTIELTPVSARAPVPPPSSGDYRLAVRVDKARLHTPPRQITTASGALSIYSERVPTEAGLRGGRSAQEAWVDLGRDALLEEFLLEQLSRKAQPAPDDAAPDDASQA